MPFDVKLYFSGSVDAQVSQFLLDSDVHRLFTFAYPKEVYEYLNLADAQGRRCRIMMDSGAFTSWSIGKPVQMQDLVAYNEDILTRYGARHDFVFISLDVIPGERGRRATPEEIAGAVDKSYDNFRQLQAHFHPHRILPVFHSGEDFRLRNAYLNLTDYICLSMDQGMSEKNRLAWAKRAAIPGFRYHGLAATGNRMVTQIGWHSVDSSSWVTVGAMGSILWPTDSREFRVLAVSSNSPSRFDAGAHVNTLTPLERQAVEQRMAELGFSVEELSNNYRERWRWNIAMWCAPPWATAVDPPMDLFSGLSNA